ncbi:MAG TPA: ABC transporter permease [Negativicutes bacterium]|nr:ABC transporter permease [Negativicutes bacterium]
MEKKNGQGKRFAGQAFLIIALLAIIEYVVQAGIVGELYLAAPTSMFKELIQLIKNDILFDHLYVTLAEFVMGYSLAIVFGIGLGLFLVLTPGAEDFFRPFLSALMAIPKVTIIPLLIIWLGIGYLNKVVVIFISCVFPIVFNTISGIKQTADNNLKVAKVFEATHWQTISKVILPSAASTIFAGLKIAAASGLIGGLFAEMLASKAGLGNLLVKASQLYNTAQVFALILVVTLLSVLIISFVDLLERKVFLKWKSAS